jgi:hypothetical protein
VASVATGGYFAVRVNNSEVGKWDSTGINLNNTVLAFTGVAASAAGSIQVPHGSFTLTGTRSGGGTNPNLVRWGVSGTNWLSIGDDTQLDTLTYRALTAQEWRLNSALILQLNPTNLDLTSTLEIVNSKGEQFASVTAPSAPADGVRVYAENDDLKGKSQNITIMTLVPDGDTATSTRLENFRLGPITLTGGGGAQTVGTVACSTLVGSMSNNTQLMIDVTLLIFDDGAGASYATMKTLTTSLRLTSGPTYTLGTVVASTIYNDGAVPAATLDISSGNLRVRVTPDGDNIKCIALVSAVASP